MKGYVSHNGRRYHIVGIMPSEDSTPDRYRLRPFKGPDIIASAADCTPWKRGKVRHIKGTLPHRDRRPVFIDLDTGAETIRVRLKGKRKAMTCTFGGLYDVLARQEAINARRDRAFRKRTGRRA
jgi:hypothetical protein